MHDDLRNAAGGVLKYVEMGTSTDVTSKTDAAEMDRLRRLYKAGQMPELAARIAILIVLGWKRSEIATGMGVSRVTVNNWLSTHTLGLKTYDDFSRFSDKDVLAPVTVKLSQKIASELTRLNFKSDRFVVPPGFETPINALWRVAYKSRGSAAVDREVTVASDALDVLISLMLRRGVTNLAIARAAGVTHRAVLDRVIRATARATVHAKYVDWDGNEGFLGEMQIKQRMVDGFSPRSTEIDDHWKLDEFEHKHESVVQLTKNHPSRFWVQTLQDDEGLITVPVDHRDPDAVDVLTRMKVSGIRALRPGMVHPDMDVACAVGRMSEHPELGKLMSKLRGKTVSVPTELLYVRSNPFLPKTAEEAMSHVPPVLWDTYFSIGVVTQQCFYKPEAVFDEFPPTTKHGPEAHTRREAMAS
jgi:hypothetical protein